MMKKETNKKDRKKQSTSTNLDGIIRSPVDAVRSRRHEDLWSNQGANISYQGTTAPGGAGSVGTGYSSGQSGVGARINASDSEDYATHPNKKRQQKAEGADRIKPEQRDGDLDSDITDTP